MTLQLQHISGGFLIGRYAHNTPIPPTVFTTAWYSITRTDDELSIVSPDDCDLPGATVEDGWALLKVLGPLDFALTGILAGLANVLAAAEISIFAISTYDTDYLMIKQDKLDAAIQTLRASGYTVHSE